MMHIESVHLSDLAHQAAAAGAGGSAGVAEAVPRALRCYLNDAGNRGPGWSYPSFLAGEEAGAGVEVRLSVDEELWRSLGEEAARQGVSAQQLLVHAVLWFAAETDAGRIAERVLDGLDDAPDNAARA